MSFLAKFYPPRGETVDREFPTESDALDWSRIQCPGAEFEHDAKTDRWTAWDSAGRLTAEVTRQKAG